MATTTRERILDAGAELFRRQGYTGTGMKQIVGAAGAPFGSLYHFFPGGKEELGGVIIRSSGKMYEDLVVAVWDASPDPLTAVDNVFAGAAETLRQTGYADACPIATIALEVASTNEPLREATAEVFASWTDVCTNRFAAAGIEATTARQLALSLIALLEGAFLLSRARRDTEPMFAAAATAKAQVAAALPRRSLRKVRRGAAHRVPE